MKKLKYILLFNLLLITVLLKAEIPDWSVNPQDYSYSMTITGVLSIEYTETTSSNDLVAAFVGNECRGVATGYYNSAVERYVFYLMVYSNNSNDVLEFKAYNSITDEEILLINSENFQINSVIGNAETPYIFTNQELSDAAEMLSFEIDGQINSTISGTTIDVEMPQGANVSNLVSSFTLSEYANAYIGITLQESGLTSNDFTNQVNYVVHAQNGDIQNYTITVTLPTQISEIKNDRISVYPNPANDFIHISTSEKIKNVRVVCITGQTVIETNKALIDVSKLINGTYILVIKTDNNIYSKSVLVNN